MTRIIEIDIDPIDVDADGITVAETLGGAGNFAITGALASGGSVTFDYARQLLQTAVGNETARTFTITGTDRDGRAQVVTMAGVNATTAETTTYWKTVTRIASDGATAGNVSFGTVDEVTSQTIPLNYYAAEAATVAVDVTGTVNYTVQQAFQDVESVLSAGNDLTWYDVSALAAQTADLVSLITHRATAVRLVVNSYSSGAELQMRVLQS